MDFTIRFNEEKNQLLKSTRRISFEDIIVIIQNGGLLAGKEHRSRLNQRIYVVRIDDNVYVVPYVIDTQRKEVFLKTIYPSRVFTKIYLKGEHDDS